MKYERELLNSCMEAVYGYFNTAKIQQVASDALREIEKLGTGESRIKKAMLQNLTADEFLTNLSTAVEEGFPYEGEVITTDIWESDYPLRFKKKTVFGWMSLAVYNYHIQLSIFGNQRFFARAAES